MGICNTSMYCQNSFLFEIDSSYQDIIETKPTVVLDTLLNTLDDRELFVYFPGGDGATTEKLLLEYINKQLLYPDSAKKVGIEGKLMVEFKIDKFGKIFNVKIISGSSPYFDKEIIRLFSKMPDWIWDKSIRIEDRITVRRVIPIIFMLTQSTNN